MDMILMGVGLGALGGVVRTIRDTYKRYLKCKDIKEAIDEVDVAFDIIFGVATGSVTFFMVGEHLSALFAGYAGADIIDGIFDPQGKVQGV